jgi:D-2-hydroxyacid dehydrogenase (NADP+)
MHVDRVGVDESVAAVFPPERLVEALADAPADVAVVDGSADSLADCEAVVTLATREAFLDLDWVHSIQAGVDRFPHDRFHERGVVLTNSTGIHGDAVGETVAGFVLTLARRIHEHVAAQQEREWARPAWDEAWTVTGEQATVVGLGGLGRGVVDQSALVGALREGVIAGAALDVFETEPLPESSPLWELDDVIVSPHCGAYTRDYHRHVATILRESLQRVAAGEDPVNQVL